MISLRKLFSLKDGTRERKIIKILSLWEVSLLSEDSLPFLGDPVYTRGLYQGICKEQAVRTLKEKGLLPEVLPEMEAGKGNAALRLVVNTLRHEFLTYTGSLPGEWDLIHPLDNNRASRSLLPCRLYLDGIRSPYNVGSIFRSAECFGFREILLSPLCADPEHPRARRSAMGCTDKLAWRRMDYRELEEINEPCFAMELGGKPISEFTFPKKGILLAGSEELGLSPRAMALARASGGIVTIPLYGGKASLNVSVACGIVMQAWSAACITMSSGE